MFGEKGLMKKKRVIRLKDTKLRKIRTEMRTIFVREANKRLRDLIKEQNNLLDESSFYEERDFLLENQKNRLRKLIRASICSCSTCSDMERVHVFNPNTQPWYCERCYEKLKRGYAKRNKPDLFP